LRFAHVNKIYYHESGCFVDLSCSPLFALIPEWFLWEIRSISLGKIEEEFTPDVETLETRLHWESVDWKDEILWRFLSFLLFFCWFLLGITVVLLHITAVTLIIEDHFLLTFFRCCCKQINSWLKIINCFVNGEGIDIN